MEDISLTPQQQEPAGPATSQPGWQTPQPETLPLPTYWPIVMAAGVVLILWGTVSTFIISLVGLAMFAVALAGWIGDLRHGD